MRLKDYNINVELTATERCGIQRYTFPQAAAAVFLNLRKAMNWDFTNDSHIEAIDSVTVQGYRYSCLLYTSHTLDINRGDPLFRVKLVIEL